MARTCQVGRMDQNGMADLLIIGGGVNGAGIARDAAGRGLSVVLVEQGDLAGATSSASSKLIHGGLRYLEYGEFRLVREALTERAVLLRIAPHIAWPMRFVLPDRGAGRPAWMLRIGLFLYDHLGGRGELPPTRRVDFRADADGAPLQPDYVKGFEYSDAWVDDARLVVLNALDAAERGAVIRTRTRCLGLHQADGVWVAALEGGETIRARVVVNAAGPWVSDVLHGQAGRNAGPRARLIKGSHVVVRRLYDGPQAYILQNDDKRVVFVLPYEQDFSLIGTTDLPFEGDPRSVAIDESEVAYLCRAVSRAFRTQIGPADVVHTYSGVRPLHDSGEEKAAAVTRDYKLHLEAAPAPILSVFGGKITTYRRLAEHALELLAPHLPNARAGAWTGSAALPGGDMVFADFLSHAAAARPWLPRPMLLRMAHAYGTRLNAVLGDAVGLPALGEDFGGGLYAAELTYLMRTEWAVTAEDALWRRSKLGLHLDVGQRARVQDWMETRHG